MDSINIDILEMWFCEMCRNPFLHEDTRMYKGERYHMVEGEESGFDMCGPMISVDVEYEYE